MQCPYCGNEDTKIIDSRSMERKKRRRRECGKCGRRFTTFEIIEASYAYGDKKRRNV